MDSSNEEKNLWLGLVGSDGWGQVRLGRVGPVWQVGFGWSGLTGWIWLVRSDRLGRVRSGQVGSGRLCLTSWVRWDLFGAVRIRSWGTVGLGRVRRVGLGRVWLGHVKIDRGKSGQVTCYETTKEKDHIHPYAMLCGFSGNYVLKYYIILE